LASAAVIVACSGGSGATDDRRAAVPPPSSRLPATEPAGGLQVTTVAAWSLVQGFSDGVGSYVFTGLRCQFVVAPNGEIYFSDLANHRVRLLAADGSVTTIAGSGPVITEETYVPYTGSFADGPPDLARFAFPSGLAVDAAGNIFVADSQNHRIRKITPGLEVVTIAGMGDPGLRDGPGNRAQFQAPTALALDHAGTLYVADSGNHAIRKVSVEGLVSTVAGGSPGFADGPVAGARFNDPSAIALGPDGSIYVADRHNGRIRRISPDGLVSTLTEALTPASGGPGPLGIAVDASGNTYVNDYDGHRILKVALDSITTTIAGSGKPGQKNGPALQAQFNNPDDLAIGRDGALYVHDARNYEIRRISLAP